MIKELWIERNWHRDGGVFNHKQVFNDGGVYVYQVNNSYYEVFKRKLSPSLLKIDGKLVRSETDFAVRYPTNDDFGKWAFCCHDKESIRRLLNDRNERLKDESFNALYKWL